MTKQVKVQSIEKVQKDLRTSKDEPQKSSESAQDLNIWISMNHKKIFSNIHNES